MAQAACVLSNGTKRLNSGYQREPFVHVFAQLTRWRGKEVLEIGCREGADSLQFARGRETPFHRSH
jgi:hypothetical protein